MVRMKPAERRAAEMKNTARDCSESPPKHGRLRQIREATGVEAAERASVV